MRQITIAAEYGKRFSEHQIYRHGAIIERSKGSRTRYYGANRIKTTPGSPKPYKTICAEFDAVLRASRESVSDFSKCNLYVARYRRDGKLGYSKPCRWCQNMISKLEFKAVFFSTENGHENL